MPTPRLELAGITGSLDAGSTPGYDLHADAVDATGAIRSRRTPVRTPRACCGSA